jgi:prevent-host-death family protein
MTTVSVHEAKTHLSRLIERVLAGEEIVIARKKEPVVRLVREGAAKKKPLLGALKGQVEFNLDDGFFDPLPEDELAAWHDGKI